LLYLVGELNLNTKHKLSALIAVVFSVSTAFGQGDFFWSTSNLNSGASNSDAVVDTNNVSDTGSLYLYYSTENSDLDTGAGLDLSWDVDGVIAFTAAETFDFDIVIAPLGLPIYRRWGTDIFPNGVNEGNPAGTISQNNVTDLNAFHSDSGMGILDEFSFRETGLFLDTGYDSSSGAFLFARVDWERIGEGTANLITETGEIGVVNDGQFINPVFGGAQFGTIPEPTSASLLAIGLVSLIARRRR